MTLAETVIALAVFWTCLFGIIAVFLTARQLSDRARDHYTAVNLAKNRLERLAVIPYDQIGSLTESNPVTVNMSGTAIGNGRFARKTEVTYKTNNLVEVKVTDEIRNRYNNKFSGEKETIQTYMTKY